MPAKPGKMSTGRPVVTTTASAAPNTNTNSGAATNNGNDQQQSSSSMNSASGNNPSSKQLADFKISGLQAGGAGIGFGLSGLPSTNKDDFYDPFFANNNNNNDTNSNSNNMKLPRQAPIGMNMNGMVKTGGSGVMLNNNNNNMKGSSSSVPGGGYVVVANGRLRVGPDGISVVDPNDKDILPPVVSLDDLVEERVLDKTNERNVTLCRREDKNDPSVALKKERYAVKRLIIKNKRDTVHMVAAEVGSAFTNRSEFTVALRNAYLRGDELILIMEYMDGRSLTDLLDCLKHLGRKMPEDVCAYITHRIAMALKTLHCGSSAFEQPSSKPHSRTQSGSTSASPGLLQPPTSPGLSANQQPLTPNGTHKRVVHRDIKPSNVLLNSAGAVKLADFGVAGSTDSIGLATFVGTTNYMCPQRIQGKAYNTPSDIWSLGTVAAEMLLGYHPFTSSNPIHYNNVPPSVAKDSSNAALLAECQPSPATTQVSQFPSGQTSRSNSSMSSLGNNSTSATVQASPAPANNNNEQLQFFQLFDRVTKTKTFYLGPDFSDEANDFIFRCLQQDPDKRPDAHELVHHPWIARFGDSCPLCPNNPTLSRMMSNSVSSFSATPSNTSITPTTSQPPPSVFGTNSNNTNTSNNSNNANETTTTTNTFAEAVTSTSSSGFKAPITPQDFAEYVYQVRRDDRDREAAAREKEKAEKRAMKERERELRHAAKREAKASSSSTSVSAK